MPCVSRKMAAPMLRRLCRVPQSLVWLRGSRAVRPGARGMLVAPRARGLFKEFFPESHISGVAAVGLGYV